MAVRSITPYLYFKGNAGKALRLYEHALGARVEPELHFGDAPPGAIECTPENKDMVMHAIVHLDGARLMVSDVPGEMPLPLGAQVQVAIDFETPEEMTRRFEALAATGRVKVPVHEEFWGTFGAVTDEFGVEWMFNSTKPMEEIQR
ncbi:MAG: VOC family protein [Thermoanaerobaculia bacterium]